MRTRKIRFDNPVDGSLHCKASMKPRAVRLLLVVLLPCLLALAGNAWASGAPDTPAEGTPPPLGSTPAPGFASDTPVPAPSAAPAATKSSKGSGPKKPKAPRDPNAPAPTPKVKKVKPIEFPLPVGEPATHIVIPENDIKGTLLMNLKAMTAYRSSNELVQMNETLVDVNHPDGTEDFHIDLPASVFNLQTHIISSDHAVTVRTKDFELTGERMEFNTVDRTGTLLGEVHMHIHNLKQVAGPQPPTP